MAMTPVSPLYLDHAATTPMRPEAREAMGPFLEESFGNPSGIHSVSRAAKAALENARERVAQILGAAHPLDIVFTGGGTESDNLGVAGPALASSGGVVTSAVEHEAVLETASFLKRLGRDAAVVGVDPIGRVDPGEIADAVSENTAVVSVMAANNETGVRQPVQAIAEAARGVHPGVLVHTDAVQAFVSEEVTLSSLGADLITLASHKFGGPKGVGLLHSRREIVLEPVLHGGGQEIGRRSGTHNVAGIVGMVAAMEVAAADRERFRSEVGAVRDSFEERLVAAIPDVVVTAPRADRLIQHAHFAIPGIDAETLLIRLDGLGVAAAAGSACQSGAVEMSHVLAAMGLSVDIARSSLRFSFGWTSAPGDGADAAAAVIECVEALR
jgi:cysteine desulfurase